MKINAPTYAATSKILVKIGREDVYTPSMAFDALVSPMISVIRQEQLNSEVQILTSDNVAGKLIAKMKPEGLYPGMFDRYPWYSPKAWIRVPVAIYKNMESFFVPLSAHLTPEQKALKRFLRKDLKVRGTGDSNVIQVTVRSKIPALAASAANQLVDLYLAERTRIHSDAEGLVFETQIRELEDRLHEAEEELKQFRATHKALDSQPERQRLQQNVDILKKSRELYLEKVEEYRINAALSSARIGNVSVISHAIAPVAPEGPKLWFVVMALMVVGIVGGISLAFLIEFLDDTIETDSDVRKYLDLPVLGKIGYLD